MNNLIVNYENLIKKFTNELLEFIKEIDNLLILNNFIWLPNDITNSNITPKEIKQHL